MVVASELITAVDLDEKDHGGMARRKNECRVVGRLQDWSAIFKVLYNTCTRMFIQYLQFVSHADAQWIPRLSTAFMGNYWNPLRFVLCCVCNAVQIPQLGLRVRIMMCQHSTPSIIHPKTTVVTDSLEGVQ